MNETEDNLKIKLKDISIIDTGTALVIVVRKNVKEGEGK
ncbi:MAG: hypothetical protein K0R54_2258 [Clostridiaceae bacterium]|jgi:hypothetical protein|nr:hypothetical protein [Clostridiaceae bacterium]